MAILRINEKKSMVLVYDNGIKDGKQQVKRKSYPILTSATEDNVHFIATKIAEFQDRDLLKVQESTLDNLVADE